MVSSFSQVYSFTEKRMPLQICSCDFKKYFRILISQNMFGLPFKLAEKYIRLLIICVLEMSRGREYLEQSSIRIIYSNETREIFEIDFLILKHFSYNFLSIFCIQDLIACYRETNFRERVPKAYLCVSVKGKKNQFFAKFSLRIVWMILNGNSLQCLVKDICSLFLTAIQNFVISTQQHLLVQTQQKKHQKNL